MNPRRSTVPASSVAEQWQVNKFLWLCLLFVAVFVPVAQLQGWIAVSSPTAYGILALAVVNAAVRTYAGWRRGGSTGGLGWAFTCVDIVLISVGVRITGGIGSELWPLYIVLMISESLYAGPAQTTALIAAMMAGYIGATWQDHVRPDYLAAMATRAFFLVIVGTFARRLSANREDRNSEMMLLNEQIAATEERARIARDVHDSLGHTLVAAILRLEICARILRNKPDEAQEILAEEIPALRAAWSEGRDLAFHLRPWRSADADFTTGLRGHIGRFAERTGLRIDVELPPAIDGLTADLEMGVMRTLQEALTNAAKHAKAGSVRITLSLDEGCLKGELRDDGAGFDTTERPPGVGIAAMQERAEMLGGSLIVRSRIGEGTTVKFTFPLKVPARAAR